MTIEEMKALKSDTEKQICDLLMAFYDKTGLVVTDHGLSVYICESIGGYNKMAVSMKMQVSL